MITLRIEPDFKGPTIGDRVLLLTQKSEEPIEVRWTGTKQDTRLLRHYQHLPIILVVPDVVAMERAAAYLGLPLLFDGQLLDRAAASLSEYGVTEWPVIARTFPPQVATGLLTKLSANSIRKGVNPKVRHVANECLFGGVSPVDADVLLSLMNQGAEW